MDRPPSSDAPFQVKKFLAQHHWEASNLFIGDLRLNLLLTLPFPNLMHEQPPTAPPAAPTAIPNLMSYAKQRLEHRFLFPFTIQILLSTMANYTALMYRVVHRTRPKFSLALVLLGAHQRSFTPLRLSVTTSRQRPRHHSPYFCLSMTLRSQIVEGVAPVHRLHCLCRTFPPLRSLPILFLPHRLTQVQAGKRQLIRAPRRLARRLTF
jgi:hypothetical protein